MTDMIDMGEFMQLSLATTASPDELRSRWLHLMDLVEQAGKDMNATGQQWKETTDPTAKDRIWDDYETAAREYRVLASWKELFYAAYIFATDGAYCAALDDGFGPPLG